MLAVIGTVQVGRLPRQAPLQFLSFQPFAGCAVSRSGTYDGAGDAHRPGQRIPAPGPRIEPLPETRTLTR